MSRNYEMASGYVASPDGRAVDNGSVVTIRLTDTEAGTVVPAANLRRADGTAWPTEGVVTDENAKVIVQWPGSGPYPDLLFADTGRGRWPMLPQDLSPRIGELEDTAAKVIDGVLVDPDGDPISTGGGANITGGGVTPDAWAPSTTYTAGRIVANGGNTYFSKVNHTSGATFAADLATRWALAGVDPTNAVTVAFGTDSVTITGLGKQAVITDGGSVVVTDVGGPPPDVEWLTYISNRWKAPYTSFPIAATIGSVPLTSTNVGAEAYRQNAIVSGNGYRGTNARVDAALTNIDLNPGVGYTVICLAIKDVVTEGEATDGRFAEIFRLSSAFDTDGVGVDITRNPSEVTIRALRNFTTAVSYIVPEDDAARSTAVTVPGVGGADLYGVLTDGWHLLTGAFRGNTGKLYLDGVEILTGVDTSGVGVFDGLTLDAFHSLNDAFTGGFRFNDLLVGRNMPLDAVVAMNAELVAAL